MTESLTPRTDAASDGWTGPVPDGVSVDFARQLERELAQAQLAQRQWEVKALNAEQAVNQAQARIAELEKDAERYRWLRENAETITGCRLNWHWQDEHRPHPPMQNLDAALDAAIQAEKK